MFYAHSYFIMQVIKLREENKILTAADTICAEIPFKSECRITDPWSEKESGNFFFLKKEKEKKNSLRTEKHLKGRVLNLWKKKKQK